MNKLNKVIKYLKGAGIAYGIYGLKYSFYNDLDYSRIKFGKKKFIYKKIS